MPKLLNTVKTGDSSGTPLLIAHGLFGTARNWGVLAKRLAVGRAVVSVDMRNHGSSFHSAENSYQDLAYDLSGVIESNGGKMDVLGHSMGGKASMLLALTKPELVRKLVIVDIAPIGYSHSQSDKIAAMKSVDLDIVKRRRDADIQMAPSIKDTALRSFLLQSLTLGEGTASWKLNLDALDQAMPEIIGFPDVEGEFRGKVLFLTGGESDYVRPEHHDRIRTLFPNVRFEEIAGAGHWLHAQKPREFEAAVSGFLNDN